MSSADLVGAAVGYVVGLALFGVFVFVYARRGRR